MASSPDTTALQTPASRPRLPFDVELFIVRDLIEVYKHDERRLAPLATVSETWQRIVEKHTFQDIKLGVQDFLAFEKFVQSGRLQLVKSITLEVRGGIYVNGHEGCDCDTIQKNFPDIISSTTAVESIHIEKWWNGFGICPSQLFSRGFKLPPSVKQLSYFYGVSRGYYLMDPTEYSWESLDLISQAAGHLEHIALSYTITANDFFDVCKEVEFKQLKTLALTYRFNGIPNNELLKAASEAAWRMPALEMMEIWEFGLPGKEAHIFRYEKLGTAKSRISWLSCGHHSISPCVYNSWKDVLDGTGSYTLEEKEHRFALDDIITFSDMVSHLMLKEHVLRASTRKRVSKDDIWQRLFIA
ncbi:hypothetical protein FNYG_07214 [Fusarium nygamai]|uniref:DUF6546 domain-containing protein n=1 Tax=Gibberella nygamai TaxID=42673 RepID=A0A2K0WAR9_GIBNY|nr:hypothetical protein FNYG_07214 [Fusarium nygamai]